MREYHNARGDGRVFNFDLLDADGGEIRVVGFNDTAVKFYDLVEVGAVYTLSKGSLKPKQAVGPLKLFLPVYASMTRPV